MSARPDPFAIREAGGDIRDRAVTGFSGRASEGSTLGEPGLGTLRRVISQRVPLMLGICLCLGLLLLSWRLAYLQGVEGARLRQVAEGNRIRLEVVTPLRGQIVDARGTALAFDVPSFNLVVLPADLPRNESDRQDMLNNVLGDVPTELLDQESLTQLNQLSYLPRVVAYHLPRDLALRLTVRTAHLPGFSVIAAGERAYLAGSGLGSVLGYVGKISPTDLSRSALGTDYQLTDMVGKTGLEQQYETELRGTPGRREVEVDAYGHQRKVYATQPPVPGVQLALTIDSELQALAYKLLAASSHGQNGGSVVAIDPRNGEIRALASYPGYDPNIFTLQRDNAAITQLLQDPRQPLFNRPISGIYPSGSTIKPFLALAGLNEHVITPQTTVLSTGGVWAGNQFFADWKAGGHGLVNVYQAIANSVNTFFYLLGGGSDDRTGLGISRIASYLASFHFGQPTGIDLAGESKGFIPTPAWKQATYHDRWYRGDTYNVSIGQGHLTVTPLQLATGYAAIANGGSLLWPHLVHQTVFPDGHSEPVAPRTLGKLNVDAATLKVVQDALRLTITAGSARSLGSVPIAVAGKTGTAQTATNQPTHAWFAGYAPAGQPELVVLVMLEHGGEGSSTAVPIAHELFAWYVNHRTAAVAASTP